jgi:indole-3-glycerol phosphate synthase/phosphoribosylanthranilate isomerase
MTEHKAAQISQKRKFKTTYLYEEESEQEMILDTIAEYTKTRIEERKQSIPLERLRAQALTLSPDTGFPFEQALRASGLSFICEIKKASPSRGIIAEEFPYAEIARDYEAAGASAISVLTEPKYFLGQDSYLFEIAMERKIPVLRKDFTVDAYQIYEARILGASAVLLICAILTPAQLAEYIELAHSLGLSALVEVHTAEEVRMAVTADARIIGVNNRNLKTFDVDIRATERLAPLVPKDALFVSESGIRTADDVRNLRSFGVDAVLIGETFMRAPDKQKALTDLKSGLPKIKICGLSRPEDILYVNEARPDYAGFVFAESKRQVSPEVAGSLRRRLRPGIIPVGVFVNADIAEIETLVKEGTIDLVQLHGGEDETYIEEVKARCGVPVIKAVKPVGQKTDGSPYETQADFLLFDSGAGSGETFDWNGAEMPDKPYFLAGGINRYNIQEALERFDAFAIDVSSGAETDGIKDRAKIIELVRSVHGDR